MIQVNRYSGPPSESTSSRRTGPIRRYTCKADRGGCGKVGIKADPVDEIVVDAARSAIDTDAVAAAAPTVDNAAEVAELAAVEARLDLLDERWASGEIDAERHAKLAASLVAKRDAARAAVEEATAAAATPPPADLFDRWDALDVDGRYQLLAAVIESVTIAPASVGGGRFDRNRIHVVWKG